MSWLGLYLVGLAWVVIGLVIFGEVVDAIEAQNERARTLALLWRARAVWRVK